MATEKKTCNQLLLLTKNLWVRVEERIKEKLLNDNKKLLSMVNYFKTDKCRRVYISEYFGFYDEKPCGNCDNCLLNAKKAD